MDHRQGTASDDGAVFGALLQRHRLAAGLSQDELAERAGLSRRGISDRERGARQTPYPATVRQLAEALGLDEAERAALLAAARPVSTPHDTPAARTPPNQTLPVALTSFVGREQELAELRRLLATSRLVTLTGTGGIGKTRLAVQVCTGVADDYSGRVWLVELGPVPDPSLLLHAVEVASVWRPPKPCAAAMARAPGTTRSSGS